MRWYLVFLASIAIVFILGGFSELSIEFPVQKEQQAQTNSSAKTPAVGMSPDERIADYTLTLDILTGILAMATIGLLIATVIAVRRQTKDTKIIQRAYIVVEPQGIIPLHTVSHTIAHIRIKNVGHLPAKNVRWVTATCADGNGQREVFTVDEKKLSGRNYVPPNMEMNHSINDALSEQDSKNIEGNGMYYFVWGLVRYDDGFGTDRFTRFCHCYGGNGTYTISKGAHKGAIGLRADRAHYHHHGNDGD
jgi:hypothetical protein